MEKNIEIKEFLRFVLKFCERHVLSQATNLKSKTSSVSNE